MKTESTVAKRALRAATVAGLLVLGTAAVHADESATPPVPSKHQMMKECMAKQKASDGGMPKDEMKRNCRDVTKTEQENAQTEKRQADQTPAPPPT